MHDATTFKAPIRRASRIAPATRPSAASTSPRTEAAASLAPSCMSFAIAPLLAARDAFRILSALVPGIIAPAQREGFQFFLVLIQHDLLGLGAVLQQAGIDRLQDQDRVVAADGYAVLGRDFLDQFFDRSAITAPPRCPVG
jgi:hypothetical protein